ncbi:hypothetical protein Dimus_020151 [Dionaea muscipula]
MRNETDFTSPLALEIPTWVRSNSIGKGSFATVSLGVNRLDGRVFAVKSVDMNSGSTAQIDALENEISILRSLSSPYVVKNYSNDVTREGSAFFRNLHLEYLSGGCAAATVVSDEATLRQYTWCVVSALKYVHSKGIVHCDVKGRNVLLGPAPGVAKLADFGSARLVAIEGRGANDEEEEEKKKKKKKIFPRGSPLWMAPEVVRGESQGFESDVWSLGCTVIEMITGKPAWVDEGADTLCRIGYSSELPRLPDPLSELGLDFLEKCLRREPNQRWSCDQLLQHPFLSSAPAIKIAEYPTPRSVLLDWCDSELSEDEGEEAKHPFPDSCEWMPAAAVERIKELAATSVPNWESDGWMEVRSSGHGASEVGTELEYFDLIRGELEKGGIISESECSSTWIDPEINCNGGASGGREAKSSCHCRVEVVEGEIELAATAAGSTWRGEKGVMWTSFCSCVYGKQGFPSYGQ